MAITDTRAFAIDIVQNHNAPKTLALLSNPESNFADVLQTAVEEVGIDKVMSVILDNDPNWALNALRYLPSVDKYQEPLIKKASGLLERISPSPVSDDANPPQLERINKLELYLDGNAGFAASFTMWWFTPPFSGPGDWKPGMANAGSFIQSDTLDDYQSTAKECGTFSLTSLTTPILVNAGDQVTMICNIRANSSWINTGFFFIYDPNATITARITATGACYSPSFTFQYMTSTS